MREPPDRTECLHAQRARDLDEESYKGCSSAFFATTQSGYCFSLASTTPYAAEALVHLSLVGERNPNSEGTVSRLS